jgi:hypothetical protein
LDTSLYEVEFDSGDTEAYRANIIAESIFSRVDDDGYTTYLLKEIIDHRKKDDTAVKLDNAYYTHKQTGKKKLKPTTRGWQLCVRWNDESTKWVPLKDLKESNPIEVAGYAVSMKLVSEPAFEIQDGGAPYPVAYKLITLHMVSDIKPDFTRKARLVAGGHLTDPPAAITYASDVSRESVRIAFLVAALNDLDMMATTSIR